MYCTYKLLNTRTTGRSIHACGKTYANRIPILYLINYLPSLISLVLILRNGCLSMLDERGREGKSCASCRLPITNCLPVYYVAVRLISLSLFSIAHALRFPRQSTTQTVSLSQSLLCFGIYVRGAKVNDSLLSVSMKVLA